MLLLCLMLLPRLHLLLRLMLKLLPCRCSAPIAVSGRAHPGSHCLQLMHGHADQGMQHLWSSLPCHCIHQCSWLSHPCMATPGAYRLQRGCTLAFQSCPCSQRTSPGLGRGLVLNSCHSPHDLLHGTLQGRHPLDQLGLAVCDVAHVPLGRGELQGVVLPSLLSGV